MLLHYITYYNNVISFIPHPIEEKKLKNWLIINKMFIQPNCDFWIFLSFSCLSFYLKLLNVSHHKCTVTKNSNYLEPLTCFVLASWSEFNRCLFRRWFHRFCSRSPWETKQCCVRYTQSTMEWSKFFLFAGSWSRFPSQRSAKWAMTMKSHLQTVSSHWETIKDPVSQTERHRTTVVMLMQEATQSLFILHQTYIIVKTLTSWFYL